MAQFFHTLWLFKYVYIVGPLIGATCSLLSVYIVLRRMAMISEGVSHSGFGGISVALLLGFFFPILESTSWGPALQEIITGLFCLVTALLIGYFTRAKKVSEDSAIGIFLTATVALGMLLLSVRSNLAGAERIRSISVEQLLFGSFTAVGPGDAIVAGIAALVVFALVAAFYHELMYVALDEEMARINGVNIRFVNTLLLVLISLVIVVSVRMVGFLMITALTIIPGATANLMSRRFGGVLLASLLIGTFGSLAAIVLALNSWLANYPPGPILVLALFGIFLVTWIIRHTGKPRVVAE